MSLGKMEGSPALERPEGAKDFEMPGTYSQLLFHVVTSTRGRQPWITTAIAERLYAYIDGNIRTEKGVLYAIGGAEHHVHLYFRWRPESAVSDLMRIIKSRSRNWMHETYPELSAFAWQEGYSVFSVSKSQEADVKNYIARQAKHHEKQDFRGELLNLFRAQGVDFDEKYVFD